MTKSSRGWKRSLLVASLLGAAACSSEPGPAGSERVDDEPGSIGGELVSYIADYEDGTTETQHFLRKDDQSELRLFFREAPPDSALGTRLHVWGNPANGALDVLRFKGSQGATPSDGIGAQASALTQTEASTPKKFCAVVVALNGATVPAACPNNSTSCVTLETTGLEFHTGPKSVNAYYQENSYGQDSLGGKVLGPFDYSMSDCGTTALATAARLKYAGESCDQWGFVMTPKAAACSWAGLGQVGTSDKPARDTWYNNTIGCVASVQEPGHNYGALHSSSITCAGKPFADDLSACTHNEYGDRLDTMGSGCRHMNAWQKLYQKWWGGCNAIKVTQSGTFNLYPTEKPCDGVQGIQIPFPGGKTRHFQDRDLTSYFLEYRAPIGFDGTIGNTTPLTAQVLVHATINPVLPNQKAPRGSRTWVLNLGGSTSVPGLTVNGVKSFTDPAGGVTFTVTGMDGDKATINVQIDAPAPDAGPAICLDGANTLFQSPGPSSCNGPVVTLPDGGGTGAGGSASSDAGRDSAVRQDGPSSEGSAGAAGNTGAGGDLPGTGGSSQGQAGSLHSGEAGTREVLAKSAPLGDVEGGCACKMSSGPVSGATGAYCALAIALAGVAERRRRGGSRFLGPRNAC